MLHKRRSKIIQILSSERMVKIKNLAQIFDVSTETIRRDLSFLEENGYLDRVYGGAVVKSMYGLEPDYSSREIKHYKEKIGIAKKAIGLVNDGDIIGIDIGTTTLEFAKALKGKKKITVITNGMQIATTLASDSNIRVIMLGGEVRGGELSTSGFISENNIGLFNIDKFFLGIGGITVDGGVTDYNMQESNLRRHVLKHTDKVIGLADHSKFGVTAMNKVCPIKTLDIIVTDLATNKQMLSEMKENRIQVLVGNA